MKKKFLTATFTFAALFAITLILYLIFRDGILLSVCITFGTFFYHFLMRLAVGTAVNAIMKNHADPRRFPFATFPFEKKLYLFLRVRKWKDKIQSYEPSLFSKEAHTYEEIAGAMCQAEVVHAIIILLSFLPIFAAIPFGAFFVFLATSVGAALYDLRFVILQRYNRPMLVHLINASKNNHA